MTLSQPPTSASSEREQLFDSAAAPRPQPTAGGGGDAMMTAMFVLLFLLSLGLLGWGIYLAARGQTWAVLAAGAVSTVAVLLAWPIARHLAAASSAAAALSDRLEDELRPMRHALDQCVRVMRNVEQNSLISERAKRVAYREKDREAIRRAIEEDLQRGDYAGARTLIDEMEKAFGYSAEADRFREEIRGRIATEREREIQEARLTIDRLSREERWVDAIKSADRLIGKYGGDIEVRLLRTRIEERRQTRKIELVQAFHDARTKPDPDLAMDLLRQLDTYLTPEEGQQLADSAREVFKGRLLGLRDQFMQAMHGHDFSEAIRIGELIKRDFPNSKLAQEVKAHEPRLREAAGVAPEEASA